MTLRRIFLIISALALQLSAGQFRLTGVMQPLYTHSDIDPEIRITQVPFAAGGADPEWRFSGISKPFIPPTDNSSWKPEDVNLTSRYGIKVSGTRLRNSSDVHVIIDASKAKVPETYPFSIAQVIDAVTTCVKLMYPTEPGSHSKLRIEVLQPSAE
jgi:hypothetical protein